MEHNIKCCTPSIRVPISMRQYSFLDTLLARLDKTLKALPKSTYTSQMPDPFAEEVSLVHSEAERKQTASLMRVNHCGEVCAQALYLGQALVARNPKIAERLYQAAAEEKAHLAWCANRIKELDDKCSILNPLFALGSFGIGVLAGLGNDKISLGFLAETEHQVTAHLDKHLAQIPPHDIKTKKILLKMKEEEESHATHAIEGGGIPLPKIVRSIMGLASKVMTNTTRFF